MIRERLELHSSLNYRSVDVVQNIELASPLLVYERNAYGVSTVGLFGDGGQLPAIGR